MSAGAGSGSIKIRDRAARGAHEAVSNPGGVGVDSGDDPCCVDGHAVGSLTLTCPRSRSVEALEGTNLRAEEAVAHAARVADSARNCTGCVDALASRAL